MGFNSAFKGLTMGPNRSHREIKKTYSGKRMYDTLQETIFIYMFQTLLH